MKKLSLFLSLFCFNVGMAQQWKSLFDGKTLNTWSVIPGGKWEIVNGIVVGSNTVADKRHGLLLTEKKYKNFIARVRYKAVQGNSGLYFRVEKIDHEVSVKGFQAEIDEKNDAGGLYETMGRDWVVQPKPEAVAKWFKPQDWNTMEVKAVNRNVTVKVNGQVSARLINDKGIQPAGYLGLQLHGGQDMKVMFKSIFIKELP